VLTGFAGSVLTGFAGSVLIGKAVANTALPVARLLLPVNRVAKACN
jgi:hypothetical protein